MTLVVATIGAKGFHLVADSMIFDENNDERWNLQVFVHARPKLIVLRNDLVVGVAGRYSAGRMQIVSSLRNSSIDEVINTLKEVPDSSFIVASLSPLPALWSIKDGEAEYRTPYSRAWIGHEAAYEIFQETYTGSEIADSDLRILTTIQAVIEDRRAKTVNGYPTRVETTPDGFQLTADSSIVASDVLHGHVSESSGNVNIRLRVPLGGDPQGHELLLAPGRPPTLGALGVLIPQTGIARLFLDGIPWEPVVIRTSSMSDLLRIAAADYGQTLIGSPPPWEQS